MLWHGRKCEVLIRAPYLRRVKRNCLIRFEDHTRLVIPCRALRKEKALRVLELKGG